MSIAMKLEKLATDIESAYDKLEEKGAIIPANKNSVNLTSSINTFGSDATATADDIINPKTAYVNGEKVLGNIQVQYKISPSYTDLKDFNNNNLCFYDISDNFDIALLGTLGSSNIKLYKYENNKVGELLDTLDLSNYSGTYGVRSASISKKLADNKKINIFINTTSSTNSAYLIGVQFDLSTNKFVTSTLASYQATIIGSGTRLSHHVSANPQYPNIMGSSVSTTDGPIISIFEYDYDSKTMTRLATDTVYNGAGVLDMVVEWSPDGIYISIYSLNSSSYGMICKCSNNFRTLTRLRQGTQIHMLEGGYSLDTKVLYYEGTSVATFNQLQNYNVNIVYYYINGTLSEINYGNNTAIVYSIDLANRTLTQLTTYNLSGSKISNTYSGTMHYPKSNAQSLIFYNSLSNLKGMLYVRKDKQIPTELVFRNTTLYNTDDVDASVSNILLGKTAYNSTGKITGTMPNNGAIQYTAGDSIVNIANGYHNGSTIKAIDITTLNDYKTCDDIADNILEGTVVLPYIELQYIQSTGTQYIDTNYKPNQDTKTEISIETLNLSSTFVPFGTRANSELDYIIGINFNNLNFIQYNSNNAVYSSQRSDDLLNTKMLISLDKTKGRINYNNTNIDIIPSVTTDFSCTTNLYLGCSNNNGNTQYIQPYKLYYCKIYGTNNNLLKDFIPVKRKSDNVICLYDKVSETYYTNAGTGTFIAGPEKEV